MTGMVLLVAVPVVLCIVSSVGHGAPLTHQQDKAQTNEATPSHQVAANSTTTTTTSGSDDQLNKRSPFFPFGFSQPVYWVPNQAAAKPSYHSGLQTGGQGRPTHGYGFGAGNFGNAFLGTPIYNFQTVPSNVFPTAHASPNFASQFVACQPAFGSGYSGPAGFRPNEFAVHPSAIIRAPTQEAFAFNRGPFVPSLPPPPPARPPASVSLSPSAAPSGQLREPYGGPPAAGQKGHFGQHAGNGLTHQQFGGPLDQQAQPSANLIQQVGAPTGPGAAAAGVHSPDDAEGLSRPSTIRNEEDNPYGDSSSGGGGGNNNNSNNNNNSSNNNNDSYNGSGSSNNNNNDSYNGSGSSNNNDRYKDESQLPPDAPRKVQVEGIGLREGILSQLKISAGSSGLSAASVQHRHGYTSTG